VSVVQLAGSLQKDPGDGDRIFQQLRLAHRTHSGEVVGSNDTNRPQDEAKMLQLEPALRRRVSTSQSDVAPKLARTGLDKKTVSEQCEVLSAIGDVAVGDDGKASLHVHVVLGLSDGSTRGGHPAGLSGPRWISSSPIRRPICDEKEGRHRHRADRYRFRQALTSICPGLKTGTSWRSSPRCRRPWRWWMPTRARRAIPARPDRPSLLDSGRAPSASP
jgi:hypothetical protein